LMREILKIAKKRGQKASLSRLATMNSQRILNSKMEPNLSN